MLLSLWNQHEVWLSLEEAWESCCTKFHLIYWFWSFPQITLKIYFIVDFIFKSLKHTQTLKAITALINARISITANPCLFSLRSLTTQFEEISSCSRTTHIRVEMRTHKKSWRTSIKEINCFYCWWWCCCGRLRHRKWRCTWS